MTNSIKFSVHPSRAEAGKIIDFEGTTHLILGPSDEPASTFDDHGNPTMIYVDTLSLDVEVKK